VKKAAALAEEILAVKPDAVVRIALTETLDEPFDVLLNATPVGMYPHGDACPVQDALLAQCACVFDAIYNPVETLLVKKARCFGKTAVGGSAMLVGQAVKAHALWNQDCYSASQVQEIVSRLEQEVAARFPAAGGASA
jgi:shikimate dehydrogenase